MARRASAGAARADSGGARSSGNLFADLWRDLRYGARMLRRTPGFTLVAIFTLALGIGANTTVFTVINTILLNPLPVARPSELLTVLDDERTAGRRGTERAAADFTSEPRRSPAAQRRLQQPRRPFGADGADVAERRRARARVRRARHRELLRHARPSSRARPLLPARRGPHARHAPGRSCSATAPGSSASAARPTSSAAPSRSTASPFTVIGVAPEGFKGVDGVFGPDLWMPAMMTEQVVADAAAHLAARSRGARVSRRRPARARRDARPGRREPPGARRRRWRATIRTPIAAAASAPSR